MTNWHIVTCEYPPQIGGVSDYTRLLARELQKAGDEVHIWAPALQAGDDLNVHRSLGSFRSKDLRIAGEALDRYPEPRTLLVQWVPHGYGRRGMNIGFTRWLASRVREGDRLYLMVHEPYLEPSQPRLKLRFVSWMQRRMICNLLGSASRVFVSIPAWETYLRPYASEGLRFDWLPIPATIETPAEPRAVISVRNRFCNDAVILGHLGTYSAELRRILQPALIKILREVPNACALLMGNHSDTFARDLQIAEPDLASRICGAGHLPDADLANHISACDLTLQPYSDGLSSRRTSLMNLISRGIPVVSNIGHLTEQLWSESQAVALSTTADATQLSALCVQLLHDGSARTRLSHAAIALYRSRFDWPHIMATLRLLGAARITAASAANHRPMDHAKLE